MLRIVNEFSAVTAVVLGLIRKFASILVSYTLFPKPVSMSHAVGLVLVFGSVMLHYFRKQLFSFFQVAGDSKFLEQQNHKLRSVHVVMES